MKGRLALLAVLLAAPLALAAPPLYLDYFSASGRSLAPTTPLATVEPLAHVFTFEATTCHRHLEVDLHYAPAEATVDVDGLGEAHLSYEFRVEVWRAETRVLTARIVREGWGIPIGVLQQPGEHEMRLSLAWGADVEWATRLRGKLAQNDPACNPPV